MNQSQFIEQVVNGLIRDSALAVLKKTLGGKADDPDYPRTVNDAISWYNAVDERNKEFVLSIAKLAIHTTIFRFLACLDGVKRIDDQDGSLSLYYKTEDGTVVSLLANIEAESLLHNLYMEEFPAWLAEQS